MHCMDTSVNKDSLRAFSRNVRLSACVLAGKAVFSMTAFLIYPNCVFVELASVGFFIAAVSALLSRGIFCACTPELHDSHGETSLIQLARSGVRATAVPLLGFFLCEVTLGIGWGALIGGGESLVFQTPQSFAMVQIGVLLCACLLGAVGGRIRSTVRFYYCATLLSLLFLTVPWVSADLAGGFRVLITALPWGFSSAMFLAIACVRMLSLHRKPRILVTVIAIAMLVVSVGLGVAWFLLLGDGISNALWRSLLIVFIAYVGFDILREFHSVERVLAETIGRYDMGIIEKFGLTNREKEVLELLLQGRRAAWIAKKLYVSESTVRAHMRHIYQKTGVHSREELMDLMDMS